MAAMKNRVEPEICTFVDKESNSMTIEVILPGVIKDQIKLKVNSRCLILSAPGKKDTPDFRIPQHGVHVVASLTVRSGEVALTFVEMNADEYSESVSFEEFQTRVHLLGLHRTARSHNAHQIARLERAFCRGCMRIGAVRTTRYDREER